MKNFIAISTETLNDKLVLINTSGDVSLFNKNGITFDKAIDFLFNLIYKREHRKEKTVFVSYGFSRDNEFIFSTLDKELKDKLFQSYNVKQALSRIDYELEQLDAVMYNSRIEKDSSDFQIADFERYVNILSKQELLEVKINGYDVTLVNGKRLSIKRKNKQISIYDIYGFFKSDSLRESCKKWLGQDIAILDRENLQNFPAEKQTDLLKIHSDIETKAVKQLAEKLNFELEKCGINLARYHGATAVSSHILTKGKAKQYFYNYKYKRQISKELDKAAYQSYYGGRVEQFKIGTLENVYIYDINSAYAFASSFLPILLSKPIFTKNYFNAPFSIWFCEYDFTGLDCYLGLLPNRQKSNSTKYGLRGKGYFWASEIDFIVKNFPETIKIYKGYYWDYERAPFTDTIKDFYELRKELKQAGNPLEKVIKKALQSVYGKFLQHQGKGYYFNIFYAGFICSLVRRMLLDATLGNEQNVICFLTDAIHATAPLNVELNNELGGFRCEFYDKVTYLDSGVYRCETGGEIIKTKHKGSKHFDFDAALNLLNEKGYYKADNFIFIGHNIYSLNQFTQAEYLHNYALDKEITPLENVSRIFDNRRVDFSKDYIDSKPFNFYAGKESALYKFNEFTENDFSLDTINARRA